jgi:hypothetical protein
MIPEIGEIVSSAQPTKVVQTIVIHLQALRGKNKPTNMQKMQNSISDCIILDWIANQEGDRIRVYRKRFLCGV